RICSNVAEGLEHAHRATDSRGAALGLVHRDVTPSNVIVSFDGVAKILDFGIAKAVAKKGRTEVGVIKGKIPYMSPEQVQGEALDARSDIFSLGTMLYELTTGHKPFDGEGPADLSMKILHDVPKPPDFYVDHFPLGLSELIQRAMSKRQADRFQSARELHEAAEEFLLHAGIRSTSHDVAAYLDGLFPGMRDKARVEAASTLPVEVTDPTVPMMSIRGTDPGAGGDNLGNDGQPLVMGELSSPQLGNYDDVRRNLGGGGRGGGSTFVIVVLVLAVAVGFWYLATHRGSDGVADKKPETTRPVLEPPKAPLKAQAKPPSELPNPSAVGEPAKPAIDAQKALEPPKADAKTADAKIEAKSTAAKPDARSEAKATAPKAAPPQHKPKPAPRPSHKEEPVKLPHLPTPPPPDDQP
ncbi:MAG: serine/threonine protein kinase, partial [bacterium]|nr:serine/threonine protein kinase [bacterium]